jgi:hypothetical protein
MSKKKSRERVQIGSIKGIFELSKLDYTDIAIGYHDNINLEFQFDLSPENYLQFAKSDLKENSEKGLINGLSNAKRSIDCLVESVLNSLSINPNAIPPNVEDFFREVLSEEERNIKPKSLKLFCALGFAPSILISEVRTLRNKIEHDYVIPKKQDVVKAIEVADLLLNNVKAKEIYSASIDLTDRKSQIKDEYGSSAITGVYFTDNYFSKENDKCKFELQVFGDDWNYYPFSGEEIEYFYFLRAMFIAAHDEDNLRNTIKLMFNHIDLKIPKKHLKVVQVHR